MEKLKTYNSKLDERIHALKIQRQHDFNDLSNQAKLSYQELRPSRVFSRVVSDFNDESEIKTNFFQSTLSIVGGYLSKRLIVGKSKGLLKSILGYGVQYLSTKIISKKINANEEEINS